MLKRLFSQTLIDLQDMEGDYRVFNLQIDKAQSILCLIIAGVSILSMIWSDMLLFQNRTNLLPWMLALRGGFVLVTALVIFAINRTSKVRFFDRLIVGWLSFIILFMLLFNYLTTVFDIIIVFAIYLLSPLKFRTNALLAFGFSIGTLYVDHFMKAGVDPITLNVATTAQIIVHPLGWLQLHNYRPIVENPSRLIWKSGMPRRWWPTWQTLTRLRRA